MADYSSYERRYISFLSSHSLYKWPHSSLDPGDLAKAGFRYNPNYISKDNVTCFDCGLHLANWKARDDPLQKHIRHLEGRKCNFIEKITPYACKQCSRRFACDIKRKLHVYETHSRKLQTPVALTSSESSTLKDDIAALALRMRNTTLSTLPTLPTVPQSSLTTAPTKPAKASSNESESSIEKEPNHMPSAAEYPDHHHPTANLYEDSWPERYAPKWMPAYSPPADLLPSCLNESTSTYESRLESFSSDPYFKWPHSWPDFSPQLLARAGFAYDPTSTQQDRIYCPCCDLEMKLLTPDLNTWEKHMQQTNCKWVHNENHPFVCRRCPERFASNTKLHANVQKHHSKQAKAKANIAVWDQSDSCDHKHTPKLGESLWKRNTESPNLFITPSTSPRPVPEAPFKAKVSILPIQMPPTPPASPKSAPTSVASIVTSLASPTSQPRQNQFRLFECLPLLLSLWQQHPRC